MKKQAIIILIFIGLQASAQIQFNKLEDVVLRQMQDADIEWGDYDNDGDLDVLLSGLALNGVTISNESYIYRNDGDNVFTNIFVDLPKFHSGTVSWGDVNNDGKLDVLLTGTLGSSGNQYSKICINKGRDKFEIVTPDIPQLDYGNFCNLNNDGFADIVLYHYGYSILINNGDTTFTELTIDYPDNANNILLTTGDINNDNYDDFLITGTGYIGGQNYTYNYIFKNNQDNTFTKIDFEPEQEIAPASAWKDLDSDGDIDLIYAGNLWNSGGPIINIYENLGNQNFNKISHNLPTCSSAKYSFADYTNNGFFDIVISGYFHMDEDEATHMFINHGKWNFSIEDSFEFDQNNVFDVAFGDIDNDNDLDMGVTVGRVWSLQTYICENDCNGNYNSIPDIPLQTTQTINSNLLTLGWDKSSDIETPFAALTYNLYVNRSEKIIINPNAFISSGKNKLVEPGNMGHNLFASFDITELQEGHYSWGIQTIDQGYLGSSFSVEKEFTIYHNNLLDAPDNLIVASPLPYQVTLIWDDNSSSESNYIVERSESNQDSFIEVEVLAPNTTSYNDQTVNSATQYYYRIKMINISGEIGYSEIKFIITEPEIANAPSNLLASTISASEISLSWVDNNSNESGFILESSINYADNFLVIDTIDENIIEYYNSGLNSGTNYFYRIKAINENGQSVYSNTTNSTTETIPFTLTDGVFEDLYMGESMAWGDFDNDNYEDVFVSTKPPTLYKNNGNATFTKVTGSGIENCNSNSCSFGIWGDYDNDGFLDLFFTGDNNRNIILHNNGNSTFTDMVEGDIVSEYSNLRSASWNDYDNDGDLDIFISNNGINYLYNYNGNHTFNKVLIDNHSLSSGISWGDYNNDGYIDLYYANKTKNVLFKNTGNELEEITEGNIVNYLSSSFSLSVSWGDYDNDGNIDLLVCNTDDSKEWLYRNNGDNTFSKIEGVFKYPYYSDDVYNGYWVDYDNDGDLDIYLYITKYVEHIHKLYTNIGNNTFIYSEIDFGEETSYYANFGSCYDYDNDGFNDIIINRTSNEILKNEGNGNNWIKVLLKGSPSNSFGIGAKVMVKANNQWQNKMVRTLDSFRSQNGNILNFGLKNAEKVDSIIVYWPMGTIQYLTNININQKIIINESDALEKPLYKPSNLNAKSSWGRILLTWEDNSENEDNFVIERSSGDSTNFEEYAVVDKNRIIYADSNVHHSTVYKYRIKAIEGGSSSDWSNTQSAILIYFKQSTDTIFTRYTHDSKSVAWIDYDNDSLIDLFIGNNDTNNILYHNNGAGSFDEITNNAVTNQYSFTEEGVWADYDNNGYLDVFVANGGCKNGVPNEINNNLFSNNNGQIFNKTTNIQFLNDESKTYTGAWGDYDKDGLLDIFVGSKYGISSLYRNIQNNEFEEVTDIIASGLTSTYSMWSDFDIDGDLDLILLAGYSSSSLQIFENTDNGGFQSVNINNIGLSTTSANCINIEDFNNDGLFDFFFAINGYNRIFINNNGSYNEIANSGLSDFDNNSVSSVCGDINNDGFLDIFVSNNDSKNYLYINNGDTTFSKLDHEPMSTHISNTNSSAFGDFNYDGNIDLFTVNSGENNTLFLNQAMGKSWIAFKLISQTNKNIIGTRIKLYYDNKVQIREIRTNSGVGAQNSFDAYFGLSEGKTPMYAKFISPTGATSILANFATNAINNVNFDVLEVDANTVSETIIYPNPATNEVNIDIDKEIKYLRVLNSSGQCLIEQNNIGSTNIKINISDLPSGHYVIQLISSNNIYYQSLLVY